MIRISNVNISGEKHVVIGLTAIFGIGITTSKKICKEANIPESTLVDSLSDAQQEELRKIIKGYVVESDRRRAIAFNIKRLIDIGSYRGHRHRKNLPVRGQRTKTNAKTRKSRRKA